MPITYGPSGQPAQSTFNYDALISTSLAAYRKQLVDNVSASNAFYKLIPWEGESGAYVAQDLLYALAPTDSYQGYDPLPTTPTNGITQVQFEWRQAATPIGISEEERKKNKNRIVSLVDSKIKQAEMSIIEFFSKALFQGGMLNGTGGLTDPYVSITNGSSFIDPLPKLVYYESGSTWPSLEVGNLNQNTHSWWRNRSKASTATKYIDLLDEIFDLYNQCSVGVGGAPDLCFTDRITYQLIHRAMREYYQDMQKSKGEFPYSSIKFFDCNIVWDDFMPNVADGTLNTGATGKGSLYFLNTKFFRCVYEEETNFVATDFMKPVNQDAKFKHILWMGTTTMSNRQKHGVLGNIARTLTT